MEKVTKFLASIKRLTAFLLLALFIFDFGAAAMLLLEKWQIFMFVISLVYAGLFIYLLFKVSSAYGQLEYKSRRTPKAENTKEGLGDFYIYKGFVCGFIIFLPAMLFSLLYAIVPAGGFKDVCLLISNWTCAVFSFPFISMGLTQSAPIFTLFMFLFSSLTAGLGYIAGKYKQLNEERKIQKVVDDYEKTKDI